MDILFLIGVGLIGFMLPEFLTAVSRGTCRFSLLANFVSAFAFVVIASRFVF